MIHPRSLASRGLQWLTVLTLFAFLGGCAASYTALNKQDLKVDTRTSTAIFVDPVPREKRTIYLDVKSGVAEFDRRQFKQFVKQEFETNDNGYRLVDDPDQAQFQMIAYVLNLEEANPNAAEAALGHGFAGAGGMALASGAATAAAVGASGGHSDAALGAGLAVGAASFIADAMVKDVTFMLVVDVQIKEKANEGVIVRKDTRVDTKVSDAGGTTQTVSEATDRKEYRTRIVTTANQVNLKIEECKDKMFTKTAYAMAGFF